jgi:secreted trypsin-like serine protease
MPKIPSIALLFLFAAALARAEVRIEGGQLVAPDDPIARSTVVLWMDGYPGCTGSIIAQDLVVTAAHCLSGNIRSLELSFSFDLKDLKASDKVRASGYRIHPIYMKGQSVGGDIALVRFEGEIPLRFAPAKVIPSQVDKIKSGATVVVAGYGSLTDHPSFSSRMYKISLRVRHMSAGGAEVITDGNLERGPRPGDSGGPLFVMIESKPYLAGVTNRGFTSCEKECESDNAFAFINAHRAWLMAAAESLRQ